MKAAARFSSKVAVSTEIIPVAGVTSFRRQPRPAAASQTGETS